MVVHSRQQRARRRASEYLAQGRNTEAAVVLESLLRDDPDDIDAQLQLALLQLHGGHYRAARALTLAALASDPRPQERASTHLAALRAMTEHAQMQRLSRDIEATDDLPWHVLADGGADLAAVGLTDPAQRWLDAALRQTPEDAAVLVRHAMLGLDLGDLHTALPTLERAIAIASPPMAHWLLANACTWTTSDHHVERLRSAMQANATDIRATAYLGFALHKELDDLADTQGAWDALTQARSVWRRTLPYDRGTSDRLFDALHAMPWQNVTPVATPAHEPTPIFILGFHRSGTTLLERMLASHPQVASGGESMRFTAQLRQAADHHSSEPVDVTLVERSADFDFAAIGRGFVQASRWFAGERRWFTEKLPGNTLMLPFILRALPQARIVYVQRDPMQVAWSMLRELFVGSCQYSYDIDELAHWIGRQHRLLKQWLAHAPAAVLTINYSDLVTQPERTARTVYAHCGLDWRDDATRVERHGGRIATASAAQARQPVHTRSLDRWRAYEIQLEPLRTALQAAGAFD